MRVLIPAVGSRGDVQLLINLAVELSGAGHEVTIATHPYWKETVESFGIGFLGMGPDVRVDLEAAAARNPWHVVSLLRLIHEIHESASRQILGLVSRYDLLIVGPAFCGAMEAIKAGKPYVSVTLMPSMVPETEGKARRLSSLGSLLNSFYFAVGPWGRTRRRYGLHDITNFAQLQSSELNLIPLSEHICPGKPTWAQRNVVTGIWPLPRTAQPLPEKLDRFLQRHPSPVIVTLGAMGFDTERDVGRLRTIVDALKGTGRAGIIQGFDNSVARTTLPESVLHMGPFPHNILFEHGALIVHHCGFGTTTTALYHGKPSVAVPHRFDQPFWAETLHRLGVCPKPIPARRLATELLMSSIHACTERDEMARNAARIGERMRAEDGLSKARELVERIGGRQSR